MALCLCCPRAANPTNKLFCLGDCCGYNQCQFFFSGGRRCHNPIGPNGDPRGCSRKARCSEHDPDNTYRPNTPVVQATAVIAAHADAVSTVFVPATVVATTSGAAPNYCTECGSSLREVPEAKFCPGCGHRVGGSSKR